MQFSAGTQPVVCDGRVIKYTGTVKGETRSHVRTQSPIPSWSDTFYFEFDINSSGKSNDISVGFFSNDENFIYHGKNGKILHGQKLVAMANKFGTGDKIGCLVRRVYADDKQYILCNFKIKLHDSNHYTDVGLDRVVEAENVWPGIYINSPSAEVTYSNDFYPTVNETGIILQSLKLYIWTIVIKDENSIPHKRQT